MMKKKQTILWALAAAGIFGYLAIGAVQLFGRARPVVIQREDAVAVAVESERVEKNTELRFESPRFTVGQGFINQEPATMEWTGKALVVRDAAGVVLSETPFAEGGKRLEGTISRSVTTTTQGPYHRATGRSAATWTQTLEAGKPITLR